MNPRSLWISCALCAALFFAATGPLCAQDTSDTRWDLTPQRLQGEPTPSFSTRQGLAVTFLGFSVVNLATAAGLYVSYQDDLDAIRDVSSTPGGSQSEYTRLRDLIETRESAAGGFALVGLVCGVASLALFLIDDPPPTPQANLPIPPIPPHTTITSTPPALSPPPHTVRLKPPNLHHTPPALVLAPNVSCTLCATP